MIVTPDPPTTAGYTVTVTIANTGLADSTLTMLTFAQVVGGVATTISTDPIPAIPALFGTTSISYTFLSGGSPGTLDLRATVTPNAAESVTTNNTMNFSTLVGPSGGG